MRNSLTVFILTAVLLTGTAWAADTAEKRLIHTTGTAELTGDNDSATIQISIITEDRHLETAHKENALKADAVRNAVLKKGIKNLSIKTASYHVYPKKDYKSKQQEIIGYKIQNTLSLTIEGLEKAELSITVSKLLDTALKHGANQIGQMNFYIKDKAPLVNEALAKATKIAIKKAHTLAKAASVTLGPVQTISSSSNQIPLHGMAANYRGSGSMLKAASVPASPVEAGESKITANVSVSYEIK